MLGRTLYFGNPYYLSLKRRQLCIHHKDGPESKPVETCPIEDLAVLVLDHVQISLSIPLLQELAENNVAVVVCDKQHLPLAQFVSLRGNSLQQKHYSAQLEASQPLKKRLWQQTVSAKIRMQAALLESWGRDSGPLPSYAGSVKSGDSDNREAAAAKHYWPSLWGGDFRRITQQNLQTYPLAIEQDSEKQQINSLLNFGYAVLRSSVARALIGSGLLLSLGIQHHNQYNPFTLADDIMEPYRPYVDDAVLELHEQGALELASKEVKQSLPGMLACDVKIGKVRRLLMNALSITSASLVRCFLGEARQIDYPHF